MNRGSSEKRRSHEEKRDNGKLEGENRRKSPDNKQLQEKKATVQAQPSGGQDTRRSQDSRISADKIGIEVNKIFFFHL